MWLLIELGRRSQFLQAYKHLASNHTTELPVTGQNLHVLICFDSSDGCFGLHEHIVQDGLGIAFHHQRNLRVQDEGNFKEEQV